MRLRTNIQYFVSTPLLVALVMATGCRSSDEAVELPPATGEGAPEPVKLPDIPKAGAAKTEVVSGTVGETTGTTYPIQSAKVAAEASGVLDAVYVDEGDRVKHRDRLFRLDAADLQLRVQQAEAALASAKVSAEAARVEYERMKRLHEKNAIDDATWDKARAGYEAAKAAKKQADVGVAMAKKMRSDATVRSPIAGVVTHVLHEVGESVSTMPPTVVVVVEDHSILELRFHIPEELIPTVDVGDPIDAHFTAVDITREAKITRVSPSVDPRTRTVEVVANIDNKDGALKSGMLAVVELGEKAKDQPPANAEKPDDGRKRAARKATP